MKNFKNDGFRKGGNDFGGRPKFSGDRKSRGGFGGGRDRDDRGARDHRPSEQKELFSATCTACKKACEVPFRPSGDKPVYCRECFLNRDKGGNQDSHDNARGRGDSRNDSRTQRGSEQTRNEHIVVQKGGGHEEVKKQLANLESKVNRILELLTKDMKTETIIVSTKPVKEASKKITVREKKEKKIEPKEETTPTKKNVTKTVTKKVAKKIKK